MGWGKVGTAPRAVLGVTKATRLARSANPTQGRGRPYLPTSQRKARTIRMAVTRQLQQGPTWLMPASTFCTNSSSLSLMVTF